MESTPNEGINFKNLELPIEKYPMAESPNLIENFLIIGYEDTYLQEVIYKNLQININPEIERNDKMRKGSDAKIIYKEYKCKNLPTILGSISSNFDGAIFDGNQIIEKVFPVPPCLRYGNQEGIPNAFENIVFTNIQNNVVNIGYAYIFYETKTINKIIVCLPKAFVIISQYPLFNTFNQLCMEIRKLYSLDQLEIPIEIQIYNIVNFINAPINSSLNMTLIPNEELFQINRLKTNEELFNLNQQEKYYMNQLSGYRCPDFNFTEIFSILSVETIIEVYLELLSGKTIGFFSQNLEVLNFTMYIYQQFLFPFAPNENVSALSPIKYFCSENVDQSLVGFFCCYDDLDFYNPFREPKDGEPIFLSEDDKNKDLDPLLFKCNFILDLDKKIFKEKDYGNLGIEESKNNQKISEYFKRLLGGSINNNSLLERAINELHKKLREFSYKLTNTIESKPNNTCYQPKFINSENNQSYNRELLNAFYNFNLNISYIYYLKVSTYTGDYKIGKEEQDKTIKTREQSGLDEEDYLFYTSFSNSLFCNVLSNFVGGYSPKEPIIYKTPKRIFDELITLKKISCQDLSELILDIYDSVYLENSNQDEIIEKADDAKKKSKKEKENKKNESKTNLNDKEQKGPKIITFLEFYKYYSSNLAKHFYYISNSDYVIKTLNKKNKMNIKYTYKYKKMEFDQNIILQYIYVLNNMDEVSKKKVFQLEKDDVQTKQLITSYYLYSCLEKPYINKKLFNYAEIIRFCVLCVVALTTSKHTLLYLSEPIYSILKDLRFSNKKFVEIILSISFRLFSQEKNKNLFFYEPYFKVYEEGIIKREIFPNDELILLEHQINESTKDIVNTPLNKEQIDFKNSLNKDDKNRIYKLEYDAKKANDIKSPSYWYTDLDTTAKIVFKIHSTKKTYDKRYSFKKTYLTLLDMLNEYNKTLDYSKIDQAELNKIIIYLIYFITILNEPTHPLFHKDLNTFLVYCLDINKL